MLPNVSLAMPRFARAHEYAGAWCLEPNTARTLLTMAQRMDLAGHIQSSEAPKHKSQIEIIQAGTGSSPKQVAVIRLGGVLMKQVSSMSAGTSTVMARRDIRMAANNPEITAIVLAIDSPGGTLAGTDDLAAEVRAANKRKPVMAFVEDLCASAAYYVASQCQAIYANTTQALIGSIGTLLVMYDISEAAKRDGVEAVVFATGPMKGMGTPGTVITEQQRTETQKLTDDLQIGFSEAVQRGRSLTAKQLDSVRTGQVWPADTAMTLRLIDGIRTFDQTVSAALAAAKQRTANTSPASQKGDQMTFEQWAAGRGYNLATMTEDQRVAAEVAYDLDKELGFGQRADMLPAPRQSGPHQADPIQSMRVNVATESRRIEAIQAAGAKYKAKPGAIAAAIESGADARDFELQLHRESYRGTDLPNVNSDNTREMTASMMEAAICMAGRMSDSQLVRSYGEQCVERARKEFGASVGLQEILLTAAQQNGYRGRHAITAGNLRSVMQHAFSQSTGFTSFSVPGVLSNVANKFLLEAYMSGDETWKLLTRRRNATDFKTMTSYRMIGAFKFEQVAPDGQLKHGTIYEQSFTNKVNTYGKLGSVTREDIINDDLGAFTGLPNELGRGAIDKLNEAFWTLFLSPAAGFYITSPVATAGSQMAVNSLTGGGSALGVTGLTNAKTALRKQVKPDGTPVGSTPRLLVVPSELEDSARVLLSSRELRDTTANTKAVIDNPHAGSNLTIVTSPYMSNANFTGYSAAAWYLGVDPAQLPGFEVAFLNGQETPIIEQTEADFDTLGIVMRGYFDFGVGQLDGRAFVKNAGS